MRSGRHWEDCSVVQTAIRAVGESNMTTNVAERYFKSNRSSFFLYVVELDLAPMPYWNYIARLGLREDACGFQHEDGLLEVHP